MTKKKGFLALLLALALAVPMEGAFAATLFYRPLINRKIARNEAKSLDNLPEAARARGLNTLAVGISDLSGETNPFFARTSGDDAVATLLYDELVFADNSDKVGAGVATFAQTADGYGYTFTIRDTVKYLDGTQVTSDDFINALYLLLTPGYSGAYDISRLGIQGVKQYLTGESQTIAGIVRVSDRSFTVSLEKTPGPDSLFYLTIPALRVSLFGDMRRPATLTNPQEFAAFYEASIARVRKTDATGMTYGQYELTALSKDIGATFTKNPAYWRGEPKITTVELTVVPLEQNQAFAAIAAGQVDIVNILGSAQIVDTSLSLGFINLETWEGDVFGYLGMDLENALFSDHAVRQALTVGLDRDSLRAETMTFYAKTPSLLVFDEYGLTWDEVYESYPYDPELAGSLLDDAGWVMGEDGIRQRMGRDFSFTLSFNQPNPYMEVAAARIQAAYKALGIKVILDPLSLEDLTDKIESGGCDMYFQARKLPATASVAANFFVGNSYLNKTGYTSQTTDWFLQNATSAADQGRRTVYYETLFQQMYMDLPVIPLYRRSEMLLISGRVMNAMVTTSHNILSDVYRFFLVDSLKNQW